MDCTLADRIAASRKALTAYEVAEVLSLSAISFFRLAENGVIPAFRVGTSLRMPLESCFSQTTYL